MTSSADETVDRGDLDPDEADRLASLIRPAWEEDDSAAAAPPATGEVGAAADRPSEARSTAIDPIPTVDVGDTLPTDMAPIVAADVAPAPVAPVAPSKTRLGIGTSEPPPAEGSAEVDEDLISTQARPVASVPPPAVAPPAEPPRQRASAAAAPPRGSTPTPQRIARASDDEPIELPVQKAGNSLKIAGAVAAVLVAGLGIALFSGGDEAPSTPTATPAATTAAPAATPAIVPPPLPPEPAASETAAPAPSTAPTAEASAAPSATPEPAAPPTTAPPAATPPPPSSPPRPPAGGGSKAPPKPPSKPPSGGIIRDAPF